MAFWTETNSTAGHRVWQRPLGVTEASFYWDSAFNGTTDTVMHVHLRTTQTDDLEIHSDTNVCRTWSSVKRRFPLLAAEVLEEGHDTQFVVREENVVTLRENDVTFGAATSFHDADRFITNILDGSRPLSPKLLARLYILRRKDQRHHFHVVLVIAHCITDGCSTSTVLRTFFNTLASPYDPSPLPIQERLQMCLSLESTLRYEGLTPAGRRWRRAIGYALHAVRLARFKGGHTLPGDFTEATQSTPAKSRAKIFTFSREVSARILSNCRRHGIVLSCAYYSLSQVALSRVLCRRYLKGEISEDEWEYRKREPMFFNGPLNIRPYQDADWFEKGGSGEVGINVSFSQYILPFLPLGVMSGNGNTVGDVELVEGAPHFPALLSFDRFLHRCEVVRAQVEKLFRHPRFVETCVAGYAFRVPLRQAAADAWRAMGERATQNTELHHTPIPVQSLGPIMTQDGSSLGNMDPILPLAYPLPPGHPLSPLSPVHHSHRAGYPVQPVPEEIVKKCETPRLRVEYWRTHMHLRPAELYLGTWMVQGQLQFFAFYDENVWSAEIMDEWLGEFREAMKWYLVQPRGKAIASATNSMIPEARL